MPFRPVRLFSVLVEQNEPLLILLRSFLLDLLDVAERVMPVLTPETLVDARPLMRWTAVVTDSPWSDRSPVPRTVVSASGVSKRYGRVPVLRGVDLAVRAGRVTAILGPNGAGKSTLIKVLLGLARPDARIVAVTGTPVGGDPGYRAAHRLHAAARRASPRTSPAARSCACCATCAGDAVPEDDELFEAFALAAELDKPVRTLSGRHPAEAERRGRVHVPAHAAGAGRAHGGARPGGERRAQGQDPPAPGRPGCRSCWSSHVLSELEDLVDDVVFLLEGRVEFAGIAAAARGS